MPVHGVCVACMCMRGLGVWGACVCVCVGVHGGGCLCMCACAEARPTGPTLLWQSQPGANAPRHGWRGLPVPVLTLGAR